MRLSAPIMFSALAVDTIKQQLEQKRYAVLPLSDFYSPDQITFLKSTFKTFPAETVTQGDTQEKTDVFVRRFREDKPGERPKTSRSIMAAAVMKVLKDGKFENGEYQANRLYRTLVPGFCIRRAQSHEYQPGSHIGLHLDADSNPKYSFAVNLNLSDAQYQGGKFLYYEPGTPQFQEIPTKPGSLTITPCDIAHKVTKVEKGERRTLAFFLSPLPLSEPNPREA